MGAFYVPTFSREDRAHTRTESGTGPRTCRVPSEPKAGCTWLRPVPSLPPQVHWGLWAGVCSNQNQHKPPHCIWLRYRRVSRISGAEAGSRAASVALKLYQKLQRFPLILLLFSRTLLSFSYTPWRLVAPRPALLGSIPGLWPTGRRPYKTSNNGSRGQSTPAFSSTPTKSKCLACLMLEGSEAQ